MKEVIARLKAAKEKEDSKYYATGQVLGRKWVEEQAEPIELVRINDYRNQSRLRDEWTSHSQFEHAKATAGEILYGIIMDDIGSFVGLRFDESNEFWDSLGATTEDQCSSKFMLGFADGAADFWNMIEDQI